MRAWNLIPVLICGVALAYAYGLKVEINDVAREEAKRLRTERIFGFGRSPIKTRIRVWEEVQQELLDSMKDLGVKAAEWRRIHEILLEKDPFLARRYENRQQDQHGYFCVHWEIQVGEPMKCVSGWSRNYDE